MKDENYIMLYNYETASEKKQARDFLAIMPQAKILKYGILGTKENREVDNKRTSLWVPESLFLVALTFFNHKDLKNKQLTIEDGLEYLEKQKSDNDFIKAFTN